MHELFLLHSTSYMEIRFAKLDIFQIEGQLGTMFQTNNTNSLSTIAVFFVRTFAIVIARHFVS